MLPILIRDAQLADLEEIVSFNQQLAWETEGIQLPSDTLTAGVKALLSDASKGRYFLATVQQRVVAQVMVTYEWSDWRNGNLWWLQSVYVLPEFRRRGVFRSLFLHIQQLVQQNPEAVGLRLYVETQNTAAQATYERLGLAFAPYRLMQRLNTEH